MTAIEEMAGMDVLCSDKTGTLTLNKLTVDQNLIEVGHIYACIVCIFRFCLCFFFLHVLWSSVLGSSFHWCCPMNSFFLIF